LAEFAAANSLSDVYAMGGKPLTAMNIVCFPIREMDKMILRSILEGRPGDYS
jgi:selenide, water dikinase